MNKSLKSGLNREAATTLMEILVVVIIVGIIAALAIPGFENTRNQALSREAISGIRLIAAAEKIYRMESDSLVYFSCNSTAACNSGLRLDLSDRNWNYTATVAGSGILSIVASQVGNPACTYTLTSANFEAEPVKSSSCPAGMQ